MQSSVATPALPPCSWYPLCRSIDLPRGKVIRRTLAGLPLALFRSQSGQVAALHAVCSHMGADLARGRVHGEAVQCALHHWCYDRHGRCVTIPATERIPPGAGQLAFPCEEQYGIVFAFIGGSPDFAFPGFRKRSASLNGTIRTRHSPPTITEVAAASDVIVANSFDGQHFATVHDRALLAPVQIHSAGPQHLSIHYRARVAGPRVNDRFLRLIGIDTVDILIHCWGGNLLWIDNQRTRNAILAAILPVTERTSWVFLTTVLPKRDGGIHSWVQRLELQLAHWLTVAFLRPDLALLTDLTLHPKTLLSEADRAFLQWQRYWHQLPRINPDDWPNL